jgi:RimJ/RimL family protein N-acetyltransferase
MTSDLVLRDVMDEDVSVFFEQQSDPSAIHMVAFTAKEPADREAFGAKWSRIRSDDTTIAKTIVFGSHVVGNVLSFVAPWSGKREVGFWIGKEYWGQGIVTRAIATFLAQCEPTRPLYASVAHDNSASLRALAKCGFQMVGRSMTFADARGEEIEEVTFELREQ